MSAMSTQRRKIAKRYRDMLTVINVAYKPTEWIKHRPHQKALIRAFNKERNDAEDAALRQGQTL